MPTVDDLAAKLDSWWPERLAASWDNVGLLLGDRSHQVEKILTCLTVTKGVVDEAIRIGAQLIVSHHPVLFAPVKKLTGDSIQGRNLLRLLAGNIAVYSPHTSHDSAQDGVNEQISRALGMINVRPLKAANAPEKMKVVVFVPEANLEELGKAVFESGAGVIGAYTGCSFHSSGVGSFVPGPGAKPTIGASGKRECTPEVRVEYLCDKKQVFSVMNAIRRVHPYEEPAFDFYPLASQSSMEGDGRIGELSSSLGVIELAKDCQKIFGASFVQVIGPVGKKAKKVAIGCGAAGSWAMDARQMGAEVFITGEMRYHEELEAYQAEIPIIILGHYASEKFAMNGMAGRLASSFPDLIVATSENDDLVRQVLVG